MESGVRLIENDLKSIKERNIPIRILTGKLFKYNSTPGTIYVEGHIWRQGGFEILQRAQKILSHPKAYIIEYEEGGVIFVGSSNISKSALTRRNRMEL